VRLARAGATCPTARSNLRRRRPSPTGRDRSLLAVETDTEIGARRIEDALNSAGVSAAFVQRWHDPNRPEGWIYLIEAFGFVDPEGKQFPRFIDGIGNSAQRILHLGGYGTPLGERDVTSEEAK